MKLEKLKTKMLMAGLAAVIACGPAVFGQGNDAILDLLVKKGVINQREANDIREQADADMAKAVEVNNKLKVPSFLSSLEWAGDLRLRMDYISPETFAEKDPDLAGKEPTDRMRFRYRARLGVLATLQDWAKVGVRLSSTGDNGDPVSYNQTFTDTFSRKEIRFDLVYVTLTPPALDWLSVTGGKMNNPIWAPNFASPMVYDNDVTPEGLAEQISYQFGDQNQFRVFGNFGQWSLKEISSAEEDVYLFDSQIGLEAKLGKVKSTVAVGYSATHNLRRLRRTGTSEPMSNSPNKGNLMDPSVGKYGYGTNTGYLDDYHVANVRGEVAWTISEKKFLGTPCLLTLSGEYIKNINDEFDETTQNNGLHGPSPVKPVPDPGETRGFTGQIMFGASKKQGEWSLAYQYKYLEADATWDALSDSDWGNGGTDRSGHVFKAAYNIRDWWQIGFQGFVTQKISERRNNVNNVVVGKDGESMLRVQVDTVFKF